MPERDFEYGAFLSHAGEDTEWCEQLAERLRNEGLRVWFDKWEMQPGDHVFARLNDGMKNLARCSQFGAPATSVIAKSGHLRRPIVSNTQIYWLANGPSFRFFMRMPLGHWKIIEDFLASGTIDQCVTLKMTTRAREIYKDDPSVPEHMTVRLIRVTLKTGEAEVLITSLLNRKLYPTTVLQALYILRWPIEEGNKSLKCHQVMEKFHAKDVNGIGAGLRI